MEWVGGIPKHWNVLPAFAAATNECIKNSDGLETNVLSLSYGNIVERDIENNFGLLPDSFNTYQIVNVGDIILRLTDLQNDKRSLRVGLSKLNGIITSAYLKLVCKSMLQYGYAYRLLHSYDTTKVFYGMGGGLRQSMKFDDFRRLPFLIPTQEEQRTIAAFIDYETARIDQLIAKQQQLIEFLKEKRQAVISHAVKIRPNEKHVKISHVIDLLTGFPFPSSDFKQSGENRIRLLRGVNVGVDQVKWDDTVFWDSQNCDSLKGYHLQCGDIVFGMDRPWISNGARVAEISNDDMPCLLLQRVARIRANHLAYQPFIKLCLASNEFRAYVEADLTGVSVPHISPEQIKSFIIRDLSYEEQVSVTTDALNKLWKLKILEQTALNAIDLIQERRTALISAAVTGKIDLRGWQPPKSEVAA